ncbi:MAG: DNA primase [Lachnospiraceae bacterium]|nr:DNA primase [Lachnospiraceae bacterium]
MYYGDDLIEEVRMKNDIVDVVSGYVKLQKKGSSYFGLCPFHNEKSPSFSVTPGKQMYYCFGCGAGGNVYTFVMQYENYDFVEAVKMLAERAGVELPEENQDVESRRSADFRKVLLEINKKAAYFYFYKLKQEDGKTGFDYLRGRTLSEETIKHFGLGYAGKYRDELYRYLKKEGYSDEVLKESGLITFHEAKGIYDKFFNRVMFPIMDVNSRVIGFGGRVMGEGEPKYLNSPETKVFDKSRNLYGLNIARTSRKPYMILCEGYMDVISLHQAGFSNAVASLGTAFTSGHASLLKRYTEEVVLSYDSDGAGVKAALRAIPICKEAGLRVKVLNMKPYKDPDEFIKNLGEEAYEERIGRAQNAFFFEIGILESQYDLKDPESKTLFINEIAKKLLNFEEKIERNNYLEAIAEKYNIGTSNLEGLVNKFGLQMDSSTEKRQPMQSSKRQETINAMEESQKLLLTWLIEKPQIYLQIKEHITPEDFQEGVYKTVALHLYKQLEEQALNPAQILNIFQNQEEQNKAAALFNTKLNYLETKQEQEKALKDIVLKVKKSSIDYATKNLDPSDMAGLQKILAGKSMIQELEKLHISLD